MADKKRIVITGMDTINPLGDSLDEFYKNLMAGKSGIKRWESIDLEGIPCQIGGDLGDYDFKKVLEDLREKLDPAIHKKLRKLFRNMTIANKSATITAINAYLDAGLFDEELDPHRISVMFGGHNVNTNYTYLQTKVFEDSPEWLDPLYGVECVDPNIPGTISEVLGTHGAAYTLGAACASGNIALRDGFRDILTGECDISVISGGFWDISRFDMFAMGNIDSLVTNPEFQHKPTKASRPFDTKRCGFVPSHGAGTLIIEDLEHAKKRGAKIHAEVLWVGANSNANHLPAPSAEIQAHLMKAIVDKAGIKIEDVDFVSCHATGTPLGDLKELTAVKLAFGDHAYDIKLNAPKSMLGHTTWVAPIVETIAGILQMKNNRLHQTINIDELAPEVDLDVCKDGPVDYEAKIMLKNSFGFGGLNCCSLIKKYSE